MASSPQEAIAGARFRCWTRPAGTDQWWAEFDLPGSKDFPGVYGAPLTTVRNLRPEWVPTNGLPAPSNDKLESERAKIAGYAEASKIEDAKERADRLWAIFTESVLPLLGFALFPGIGLYMGAANAYAAFAGPPDDPTRKLFVDAAVGTLKAADEAALAAGKKTAEVVIAGAGGLGVIVAIVAAIAGFMALRNRLF